MEEKHFLTIPNDKFREKCFDNNKEKFESLSYQLMIYNGLFQNEMIFLKKEMDDNLQSTLKMIDELRDHIIAQQKEIEDELLVVQDYDQYIQEKYRDKYI